MNRLEQERFIESQIKGLWPRWDATDAEVRVWMSELAALDYDLARTAAQACFTEQTVNYHRPVLGRFLERARALSRRSVRPQPESPDHQDGPTTNVFVECLDPPPDKPHLAGVRKPVYVAPAPTRSGAAGKQSDSEHVQACADSMRARFALLYGGHWIAVVTKPRPDDGLRGEPARRRAYGLILAGPDTPARRCLQDLLARRAEAPELAECARYAVRSAT